MILSDKKIIESHFRKNTDLNIYQIGDLDDFFWGFTKWYASLENDKIRNIAMMYSEADPPVMIALCDSRFDDMKNLLIEIKDSLPSKFYSHLSPGINEAFLNTHVLRSYGKYYKMSLGKMNHIDSDQKKIRRLTPDDCIVIKNFYDKSYPENWFDKRMLETGKYFGYFIDDKLAGISGIHVYSEKYKVAALGNIATDPDLRGKSICTKVTAALCNDLKRTCDNIGLNVSVKNAAAIKSYERIGFRIVAEYEEFMIEKN